MLSSKPFLSLSESLHSSGFCPEFDTGMRIARGYADLGIEEFCMLSPTKMVSLFSGKVSELPPDHYKFFFCVPTVSDLVSEISKRNYDIMSLQYRDQRRWELQLVGSASGAVSEFVHDELECVFAEGLAKLISNSD